MELTRRGRLGWLRKDYRQGQYWQRGLLIVNICCQALTEKVLHLAYNSIRSGDFLYFLLIGRMTRLHGANQWNLNASTWIDSFLLLRSYSNELIKKVSRQTFANSNSILNYTIQSSHRRIRKLWVTNNRQYCKSKSKFSYHEWKQSVEQHRVHQSLCQHFEIIIKRRQSHLTIKLTSVEFY